MNYLNWVKTQLNQVGPGFCLAKFYQVGMHLETGRIHSCIHPQAHHVPVEEVQLNYHALHNDRIKQNVRQQMFNGKRPSECGYCWKLEDADPDIFSDRIGFSSANMKDLSLVTLQGATHNYYPTNVEISFSITCNFKCVYCAPQVSSQWLKDLKKNGPYSHQLWSLETMATDHEIPIDNQQVNPYVDAFWQWLPEAYPHMQVLRVTGGEPLLSSHTFKLIDWVIANPNPNLEFGINTNLEVPELLIERLIAKLSDLQLSRSVKSITIWTSGESHGAQWEYQRQGGCYETWKHNIKRVLDSAPWICVRIMTTYNVLSVTGYLKFLQDMYEIQQQYGERFVVDSHTYLQYPQHLAVDILTEDFLEPVQQQVDFVRQTQDQHSVLRAERLLKYFKSALDVPSTMLTNRRKEFYNFVHEYDARTGTNFQETFPELRNFLEICKS
jgi:organic radical activating enzyme